MNDTIKPAPLSPAQESPASCSVNIFKLKICEGDKMPIEQFHFGSNKSGKWCLWQAWIALGKFSNIAQRLSWQKESTYWQYRTNPNTAQCTQHTHTLHQGFPGDAQKRENVWTIFRPGGKALNVKGFFFKKRIWLYVDITSAHLVWDVLKKST